MKLRRYPKDKPPVWAWWTPAPHGPGETPRENQERMFERQQKYIKGAQS